MHTIVLLLPQMRSGRLTPPLERDVTLGKECVRGVLVLFVNVSLLTLFSSLGRASAHERVRRVADLALRVRARAGVDAHRRAPSAVRDRALLTHYMIIARTPTFRGRYDLDCRQCVA
jgi:hypothetical protein